MISHRRRLLRNSQIQRDLIFKSQIFRSNSVRPAGRTFKRSCDLHNRYWILNLFRLKYFALQNLQSVCLRTLSGQTVASHQTIFSKRFLCCKKNFNMFSLHIGSATRRAFAIVEIQRKSIYKLWTLQQNAALLAREWTRTDWNPV